MKPRRMDSEELKSWNTLEESLFPDGEHGHCDYCQADCPKWGMTYSLRTGKLSCGCHTRNSE